MIDVEDLDMDVGDEDGWSYSLPLSLDSLPLESQHDLSQDNKEEADGESVISELEESTSSANTATAPITIGGPLLSNITNTHNTKGLKLKTNLPNLSQKELPPPPMDGLESGISDESDQEERGGVPITTPPKQVPMPSLSSMGSSLSTSNLTQMMKSTPAGPLTTVEEVHNKSSPSRSSMMELSSLNEKDELSTSHKKLTDTIYQLQQTISDNSISSKEHIERLPEKRDREDTPGTTDSLTDGSKDVDTPVLPSSNMFIKTPTSGSMRSPTADSNGSFFSNFKNVAQSMLQSPSSGSAQSQSHHIRHSSDLNGQHLRAVSDTSGTLGGGSAIVQSHRRVVSNVSSMVPTSEEGEYKLVESTDNQPAIISYRRTKKPKALGSSSNVTVKSPTSASSADSPVLPPTLAYDKTLYIDEFYKDTQYRYATLKRNADFHNCFESIPIDDRLLDDFSCALNREFLVQGRMYVSENYMGFNSNILGWVTNFIIPLSDVVNIEKTLTAGFFNNGISIETKDNKHYFATFISRDATFQFFNTIWEKAVKLPDETSSIFRRRQLGLKVNNTGIGLIERKKPTDEELRESLEAALEFTMSIDGDTPRKTSDNDSPLTVVATANSGYINEGPAVHEETELDYDTAEHSETLLFSEIIDAPPGVVFSVLFGPKIDFHRHFLELMDSSNFSDYSQFVEKDGKLIREYNYSKELGYSIGPKSTKVVNVETIEKKDFDSTIIVVNKSMTPDVPSGNAFSVNTRYVFAWGPNNNTKLQLSYFMNWTGKSWFKGVIESQTNTGQMEASKVLLRELKSQISQITLNSTATITAVELAPVVNPITPITRQNSTFKQRIDDEVVAVENAVQALGHEVRAKLPRWLTIIVVILFGVQMYTITSMRQHNVVMEKRLLVNEYWMKQHGFNYDDLLRLYRESQESELLHKIEDDLNFYEVEMSKQYDGDL